MTTYALEPEVETAPPSRWVIEDVPTSSAPPAGRSAPGRSRSNGDTPASSGSKLASFIDATGLPEFWSRTNANVKAGWDALKESPDQLWKAVQSVAQSVREDRQGNRAGAMAELGGAAANVAQAGMGIAAFPFTPLFAPVQAGFEQAAGVLPKPDQPIMKIGDASITPRQLAGIVGMSVAAGAIPKLIPTAPASVPKEYILKAQDGRMGKVAVTNQGNLVYQPITNPRTARAAGMERDGRTTVDVPNEQFTGMFSGNPEARAQFIEEHNVPVSTPRPAPGRETPPDVVPEAPPAASVAPTIDEPAVPAPVTPAPTTEVSATGQPQGGAVLSEPVVPEAGVQAPTAGGVPPDMAPVALDAPAAGSVEVTPPTSAELAVPEVVKQPWEMTREEFDNKYLYHGGLPRRFAGKGGTLGQGNNSVSLTSNSGLARMYRNDNYNSDVPSIALVRKSSIPEQYLPPDLGGTWRPWNTADRLPDGEAEIPSSRLLPQYIK